MFTSKITSLLFTFMLLSCSLLAQTENGSVLKKGDKIPLFSLSSTINGKINSKDLKGKVVLINLFATWCGPCQKELAEVEKTLWTKYKDNSNFKLLVIGREHTDKELKAYNKKKNFSFPLYPDPKREVTNKFATKSIPRAYLIDKKGNAIHASIGYSIDEFNKLMELIEEQLNQ